MASRKALEIKKKLVLKRNELMFLLGYEAHYNLTRYENEKQPNIKVYFKRIASVHVSELTDKMCEWKYGNIEFIVDMIGEKIDQLRKKFRKLVSPNILKVDDKTLGKMSILIELFCKFLLKPSIEIFELMNNLIDRMDLKEQAYLTRR